MHRRSQRGSCGGILTLVALATFCVGCGGLWRWFTNLTPQAVDIANPHLAPTRAYVAVKGARLNLAHSSTILDSGSTYAIVPLRNPAWKIDESLPKEHVQKEPVRYLLCSQDPELVKAASSPIRPGQTVPDLRRDVAGTVYSKSTWDFFDHSEIDKKATAGGADMTMLDPVIIIMDGQKPAFLSSLLKCGGGFLALLVLGAISAAKGKSD